MNEFQLTVSIAWERKLFMQILTIYFVVFQLQPLFQTVFTFSKAFACVSL